MVSYSEAQNLICFIFGCSREWEPVVCIAFVSITMGIPLIYLLGKQCGLLYYKLSLLLQMLSGEC
jgi:hypothetical protein